MDKKGSNIKKNLPSRHVSVGPKSAPHRSMYYAMGLTEEEIDLAKATALAKFHLTEKENN